MDLRLIATQPGFCREKDRGAREGDRPISFSYSQLEGSEALTGEACLHPRAKGTSSSGTHRSIKVYHFTAVEILTSILK